MCVCGRHSSVDMIVLLYHKCEEEEVNHLIVTLPGVGFIGLVQQSKHVSQGHQQIIMNIELKVECHSYVGVFHNWGERERAPHLSNSVPCNPYINMSHTSFRK